MVRVWLARRSAAVLLALTVSGLTAGLVLYLAGAGGAGNVAWAVVGVCGAGYALWAMAEAFRRGRIGVDVIALLAVVGALAVGELLAAAVISVMLASGRALEAWAAGRARRDLRTLLERAPRTARRYTGRALVEVPLDVVTPGDLLLVAPGELVPVDGTVTSAVAVLDESALTGEARPVERSAQEPVRSGVVNAGGPFDLRATATAADSTYAGIVRLVSEAEASPAPFVRLADRYAVWFLLVSLAAAGAAWVVAGARAGGGGPGGGHPVPADPGRPVALVSGLSVAARRGVVVKGGGVLERLAQCSTLLLDKTGTLTTGRPSVSAVVPAGSGESAEVLRLAASLDQVSRHVLWLVRWSVPPRGAAASWCCRSRWRRCPGRGSAGWSPGARWPSARPAGWAWPAGPRGRRRRAAGPGSTGRSPCSSPSTGSQPVRSSSRTRSGPTPPARSVLCATAASAGSSWSPVTAPRSPTPSAP